MNKRPMPRSFFWIDQELIRSGLWERLSGSARLIYVALSASCDRSGVSQWGSKRLMSMAAIDQEDSFAGVLTELEEQRLIERVEGAIRLTSMGAPIAAPSREGSITEANPRPSRVALSSITIQTIVKLDGGVDVER